jgi:hypothetical protein
MAKMSENPLSSLSVQELMELAAGSLVKRRVAYRELLTRRFYYFGKISVRPLKEKDKNFLKKHKKSEKDYLGRKFEMELINYVDPAGQVCKCIPLFSSKDNSLVVQEANPASCHKFKLRNGPVLKLFKAAVALQQSVVYNPEYRSYYFFSQKAIKEVLSFYFDASTNYGKLFLAFLENMDKKADAFYPEGGMPPTFVKLFELIQHCFGDYFVFTDSFNEAIKQFETIPSPEKEESIHDLWKMFASIAGHLHIMLFVTKNFSIKNFLARSGFALTMTKPVSEQSDDSEVKEEKSSGEFSIFDLEKQNIRVNFSHFGTKFTFLSCTYSKPKNAEESSVPEQ